MAAGVPTIWMGVLPQLEGRDTVQPAGHPLRRLGRAQGALGGLPPAPRPAHPAGLGDDRDEPDRGGLPRSSRRSPRPRTRRSWPTCAARSGRRWSASSSGSSSRAPRTRCPGTARRAASCRSAGPWIATSYYDDERAGESFTDDGWLRTGDVATVDADGYIRLVDRTKDLIKSGGEWISSVELENELMAHPKIREAAVIGVPHPRWSERPLACVVLEPGEEMTVAEVHRPPRPVGGQVAAARRRGLHRRGAEDQRRQVLQADAAGALRRLPAPRLSRPSSRSPGSAARTAHETRHQ